MRAGGTGGAVEVAHQRSVKALVVSDGRVLLLREASTHPEGTTQGCWGLPGGRIDGLETPAQALAREVRAETGLTVALGIQVHSGRWSPVIADVVHLIRGTFYYCPVEGQPAITLSNEHDQYAWADLWDLGAFVMVEPDRTAAVTFFLDHGAGMQAAKPAG